MTDDLLWATGFFFLGVVVGVRLGVWWFTKVRPQSQQIDADAQTLRDLPSATSLPGMFDDEPELPHKPPAGLEPSPEDRPAGTNPYPGLSDQLGRYPV